MSRIIDLPSRNRTSPRRPLPILLILSGTSLFCAGLLIGALLVIFAVPRERARDGNDRPKESAKPGKGRMTQAEIKKTAVGKTPREVLKAFGKPDSTYNTPDDLDAPDYKGSWTYFHLYADPANGADCLARLQFQNGKVDHVEF
jgi:hypothetical protein